MRIASIIVQVMIVPLVIAGLAGAAVVTGTTPPQSVSPPVVTGKAQVGSVLVATSGKWRSSSVRGAVFSFQWQRCDSNGANCVDRTGAIDSIYPLGADDAGVTLRVVVTASKGDTRTSADSEATKPVVAGQADAPSSQAPPTISGTLEVGSVLTAQAGEWAGTQPIKIRYRWRRCSPAGGSCRALDEREQTHTVRRREVGSTFRVLVLAENASGVGSALSSATSVVVGPPLPVPPKNTALPTISGTAQQGKSLVGTSGSWSGTAPIGFSYRWLRCDDSGDDCDGISGANGQSYTVANADAGHALRLRVAAKNVAGTRVAVSARTQVVAPAGAPPVNVAVPAISGHAREGSTLTAFEGKWRGDQPIRFSFQWLRCDGSGGGCASIGGADLQRYVPGTADIGRRLRVQVQGTNAWGSGSVLSTPTATIAARGEAPSNRGAPVLSGAAEQGATLSLSTGSWSGTQPITYGYRWVRCDSSLRGCRTIGGARSNTYGVTRSDVGRRLYGVVTAKNSAGTRSTPSNATGVVVGAPFNTGAPTITGSLIEGRTLTAQPGSWTGVGTISFIYQWTRCAASGEFSSCVPIVVTSSSSYTLGSADVGRRILVQVKASNGLGVSFANSRQTDVVQAAPASPPPPPPSPPAAPSPPAPTAPVTIAAPRGVVGYGGALTLYGRGRPGQPVTIVQRRVSGSTRVLWNVAVVSSSGRWRYVVRPTVPSTYQARVDGRASSRMSVRIRPVVALNWTARGKLVLRVRAARSFSGRTAVVQRWDIRRHRWVERKRVRLGHSSHKAWPSVVTVATFRPGVRHGTRVRVVFPGRNAGLGYLTAVSNRVRA